MLIHNWHRLLPDWLIKISMFIVTSSTYIAGVSFFLANPFIRKRKPTSNTGIISFANRCYWKTKAPPKRKLNCANSCWQFKLACVHSRSSGLCTEPTICSVSGGIVGTRRNLKKAAWLWGGEWRV